MQLGSLEGKRCLVTGGTKGIGEATAKLFVELGAEEVLIVGRDRERGERIAESSEKIRYQRVDLEDLDDARRFAKWLESDSGGLDVVVSNASRDSRYNVLNIPFEEWEKMLALNLTSPFLICRAAAQRMVREEVRGKIILVGAIQAIYPLQDSFAYVSTKGGAISMMKSMATDLGRFGIQVLSVLPGPIYIKDGEVPHSLDERAAPLLGRMGRREEVAKVIAFLASDDNSFITGSQVIVDGGRLISRRPDPAEISTAS